MAGSATGVLCDRETSRCPRTVLGKRQEKRATFSREVQARGRSSPRALLTTLTVSAGAGGGVKANVRRRERALDAPRRAATPSFVPWSACLVRGIPGVSSAAVRAPTPLPEPCTPWDLAQAVWCVHISETARAT